MRTIFAWFLLFSYSLLLVHNVVPHHHHSEHDHLDTEEHVHHHIHGEVHHFHVDHSPSEDFWNKLMHILSEAPFHDGLEKVTHFGNSETEWAKKKTLSFAKVPSESWQYTFKETGYINTVKSFIFSELLLNSLKNKAPPVLA